MHTVPTPWPSSRTYERIHRTWSDISSSPTLAERSAASFSSSGDFQPLRRRMTYVFIALLCEGRPMLLPARLEQPPDLLDARLPDPEHVLVRVGVGPAERAVADEAAE